MASSIETSAALSLLGGWADFAESYWYDIPDLPGAPGNVGCFGTGYEHWGVQTNQRYVAAMATLAACEDAPPAVDRQRCRDRAMAALRYMLRTHHTGDLSCTDGSRWGRTWISALGLERMAFAIPYLLPHLTDEDRERFDRVFVDEADWLTDHYQRGQITGIVSDRWDHSGKNAGESNLWNGCFLWRVSQMRPDHPRVAVWQEQAHRFLLNAINVAADADDDRLIAGKPLRDWHLGAGFFDQYAFDHHGYTNVGYMVICSSHQAILHFDSKCQSLTPPESLHHHAADLWRVARAMVFPNGRLARIGGDSRVRYTYCQEYLLPTLLYAADHLGDAHAIDLANAQIQLMAEEAAFTGDGSFYGKRLQELAARSPYYYTRLESDRACVLAMAITYADHVEAPPSADQTFEQSVATLWSEPEHGDVLHRCPTRFASFAWRACGLTQGLCVPPNQGHMAEWELNMAGRIRFVGDDQSFSLYNKRRCLESHRIETFDGGFLTYGSVIEGERATQDEGWKAADMARHHLVIAALPDGHTVVGLQFCRMLGKRGYLAEVKGLGLGVPNDLYNGMRRRYAMEGGELLFESPARGETILPLKGRWANINQCLGVVGLYGADELTAHRVSHRRGGPYHTLYVDQVNWGCDTGCWAVDAGRVILDVGWAVLASVDLAQTRAFAESNRAAAIPTGSETLRAVRIRGLDAKTYTLIANFDEAEQAASIEDALLTLAPGEARLL